MRPEGSYGISAARGTSPLALLEQHRTRLRCAAYASVNGFGWWPFLNTGHFTQVVWNGSTRIGCARAQCPLSTLKQDPSLLGDVYFYVCRYAQRGNTDGEYAQNVKAQVRDWRV
jgi:hypothetical protein